jgi:hypothetical protein
VIVVIGSAGIGIVWGWLSRLLPIDERSVAAVAASVALLAGEAALIGGEEDAALAVVGGFAAGLLLHHGWRAALGAAPRGGGQA